MDRDASQPSLMIAVCGLDCRECDIYRAPEEPARAQQVVDWFRAERKTEVQLEQVRCLGCRGDRAQHWSPDCWIPRCCVGEKGLGFCYECEDFPCGRLAEWAKGGKRYAAALRRLQRMRPA